MPVAKNSGETTARHRPKALTVFAAAFVAGAAAAVGVNRLLDVHIARSKPQIECEPIFVALRSLPQGAPVTVWDVALRDWPKAMLPGSALRAHDSFEGLLLRHPLREGQPLLAVQLMRAETSSGPQSGLPVSDAFVSPVPAATAVAPPSAQTDLWTPAEAISQATRIPVPVQAPEPAAVAATDIPASSPAAEPTVARAVDVAIAGPDLEAAPIPGEPAAIIEPQPEGTVASEPVTATEPVAAAAPVTADTEVATDTEQEVAAQETALQHEAPADVAVAPTPAPTGVEPQSAAETAPSSVDAAAADTDAPQPTESAALPSVMTSTDEPQAIAAPQPSGEQPRRYLVVPERIALQADSSFSAPAPATTAPPATVPPVSAATTPRPQQPVARQPAPRAANANRSGPAPAASRQPTQSNRGQQAQPKRGQPAQAPQRPRATTTTQRPRERAFPAMAAGLDAIGQQWQQLMSGEDTGGATGRDAATGDDRRR